LQGDMTTETLYDWRDRQSIPVPRNEGSRIFVSLNGGF